ncbi:MAG: cyclic nucleotide-binding domain-containing protein [Spirochaetales bacterium]
MSLVAVLNSRPDVKALLEKALVQDRNDEFLLHQASNVEEALEILSFDLPEIVIWNATDPELDSAPVLESLLSDSWMHNFGIIAIYDSREARDTEVSRQLAAINVLTVLSYDKLKDSLYKHLRIIDANRQILVHLEVGEEDGARTTGSFNIDNDPMVVPVYTGLAAQLLVQRGRLLPNSKRDLQIALSELVQNGIEHGNCGLTATEKAEFLSNGGNISDLISEKIALDPALGSKKVTLEWEIRPEDTRFFVRDQGNGFDVAAFQQRIKSLGTEALSGRGIKLAKSLGGKLSYNRTGNVACLTVIHSQSSERKTPRGFEGEQVLIAKKGDIVFRQGELSDHIFYITSGQFGVYHDGVEVGRLSPADVFMGEMSFLMNNMRTATVICENPGRIIKIARRSFVKTLRLYPQYGLFLAKLMARKLSAGNQVRARQVLDESMT